MKKLHEICTLCGVEGCTIIYENNNSPAEVWPSDSDVINVLSRFMSYTVLDRSKYVMDQSDFLRQSIRKAEEKLKKLKEENRKNEMTNIYYHFLLTNEFNGNLWTKYDRDDFSSFIDGNLKEIVRKMERMQIEAQEQVGNIGEAMDGTMVHENIGHVQGLLNGANLEANMGNIAADVQGLEGNMDTAAAVQGLEANMNYGMESDFQDLLMDLPPFDDINLDTTIFGQTGPNFP
jgi:Arc/MetJ-type ribon-helix-helix transcriptional regulator